MSDEPDAIRRAARRGSRARRCAMLIAGVLATGVALAACGEQKRELPVVDASGYSVSMPGKPRHDVEYDDTPDGSYPRESYFSVVGSTGYALSIQIFPFQLEENGFDGVPESASGSKVLDLVKTSYKGYPAHDFRRTTSDGRGTVLFARTVIVRDTLVYLQYGPVDIAVHTPPGAYVAFRESLKIP